MLARPESSLTAVINLLGIYLVVMWCACSKPRMRGTDGEPPQTKPSVRLPAQRDDHDDPACHGDCHAAQSTLIRAMTPPTTTTLDEQANYGDRVVGITFLRL